ncbi:MAG: thiamine-phosphate kinase [Cyanobacteria bacterium]|nr:thiamine-phosphate kinase [Cyanobacteriota bacterium]
MTTKQTVPEQATPEQALIQTIQARLGEISMGQDLGGHFLGDDAAWNPETRTVTTTDLLVEGQHFDTGYFSLSDIGWKAMAVNYSDIAAMGAYPDSALVSLGLPKTSTNQDINALYDGIIDALKHFGGQVIGGDTVGAPCWIVNVCMSGKLRPQDAPGFRSGAQAGDIIMSTGFHGLSALGLWAYQTLGKTAAESRFPVATAHHRRPTPQLKAGQLLSQLAGEKILPHYSLMDSSDGLADAVLQLCSKSSHSESGKFLAGTIEEARIPVHPELTAAKDAFPELSLLDLVLYGGEDFELVATVPKTLSENAKHTKELAQLLAQLWKYFQPIGYISPEESTLLESTLLHSSGDRSRLDSGYIFNHFSGEAGLRS